MNWRELMRIQNSEKHGKKSDPECYVLAGTQGNSEPQKALTKLTEPRPARTPVKMVNENLDSPPHKQNMNRTFLKFDAYATLENLRAIPAKVGKVAKVEPVSPEHETNTYDREPGGESDQGGSPVETALTIVRRLRGYVLPAGRMAAARAIAARLRPLLASADLDLADTVRLLIEVEDELTRLGGRFDAELAEAIEVLTRTFPGSKLVH
ncbi:MAG: hypothetical protein ACLQU2_02490 [Candidatus Binataceae bacterium]